MFWRGRGTMWPAGCPRGSSACEKRDVRQALEQIGKAYISCEVKNNQCIPNAKKKIK